VYFRAVSAFYDVTVGDDAIGSDEEPAAAREFFILRIVGLDGDCGRFDTANEFGE
jgi:hypothetical protein